MAVPPVDEESVAVEEETKSPALGRASADQ